MQCRDDPSSRHSWRHSGQTTGFGLPLLLPANGDTGRLGNDERAHQLITNSLHAHPSLVCIVDIDC